MPILIKDVTGAKEPIELNAPIVIDASAKGVKELQQFIDALRWSRNTDVAAAEAKRLAREGYWRALSAFVQGAISEPLAPPKPAKPLIDGKPDTREAEQVLQELGVPYIKNAEGFLETEHDIILEDRGLKELPDLSCVIVKERCFNCSYNYLRSLRGMPRCKRADVKGNLLDDLSDLCPEAIFVSSDFGVFYKLRPVPAHLREKKDINKQQKETATPQALQQIFNDMAAGVRSTLISEAVLLTSDVFEKGPMAKVFSERRIYDRSYSNIYGKFRFGFFQVDGAEQDNNRKTSTTFATFTIDAKCLKTIKRHAPKSLLADFQAVMSFVNHDMLHHLTAPIVTSSVVGQYHGETKMLPIHRWSAWLPLSTTGTEPYEDWAQIAHEKIQLHPDNKDGVVGILKKVDHYFDELQRISNVSTADKNELYNSINYFGDLMAHALSRVFPLGHPVMQHCFERMVQVDPDPKKSLDLFLKGLSLFTAPVTNQEVLSKVIERDAQAARIIELCGLNVSQKPEDPIDPISARMIDLIRFTRADIIPHASSTSETSSVGKIQRTAAERTLNMVLAANETAKILNTPKPGGPKSL